MTDSHVSPLPSSLVSRISFSRISSLAIPSLISSAQVLLAARTWSSGVLSIVVLFLSFLLGDIFWHLFLPCPASPLSGLLYLYGAAALEVPLSSCSCVPPLLRLLPCGECFYLLPVFLHRDHIVSITELQQVCPNLFSRSYWDPMRLQHLLRSLYISHCSTYVLVWESMSG